MPSERLQATGAGRTWRDQTPPSGVREQGEFNIGITSVPGRACYLSLLEKEYAQQVLINTRSANRSRQSEQPIVSTNRINKYVERRGCLGKHS